MKVNAIIQARCGATRLPEKVFAEIAGKPLLWHVVDRIKQTRLIGDVIVATSTNVRDDKIEGWCKKEDIKCFRGSENDVLNRYYSASIAFPSDVIVRVTADDPFKEPRVMDQVISKLLGGNYDLTTNNFPPSYPEGLDCEAFTFAVLEKMEKNAEDPFEREHVTQHAYHNPDQFKIGNICSERQLSSYRWTIDNGEDLEMVRAIYDKRGAGGGMLFMEEILAILHDHPEIALMNSNVKRSAMYQ